VANDVGTLEEVAIELVKRQAHRVGFEGEGELVRVAMHRLRTSGLLKTEERRRQGGRVGFYVSARE
jgi:DNA-binding transcriptional regulator PaaX